MTKRFQKELELYLIGEHDEPDDVEASLASDESSLAFLVSEAQFETLLRDAAAAATFCPGCKDLVLTDRCDACGIECGPGGRVVEANMQDATHLEGDDDACPLVGVLAALEPSQRLLSPSASFPRLEQVTMGTAIEPAARPALKPGRRKSRAIQLAAIALVLVLAGAGLRGLLSGSQDGTGVPVAAAPATTSNKATGHMTSEAGSLADEQQRVRVSTQPATTARPFRPAADGAEQCPAGMVHVPSGTFQMGSPSGVDHVNEAPQHTVTLSGYCIDKTEVTVSAYQACVKSNACPPATLTVHGPSDQWSRYCNGSDRPKHPVNCVDWNQAVTYCTWAGKRLPTEAEWEYAARGTDGRSYPWGNDAPNAKLVNTCGSECAAMSRRDHIEDLTAMHDENDGWETTAPVGSFPAGASPFGALDMAGNVSEWTADRFGPLSEETVTDPQGATSGGYRVARGGDWINDVSSTARVSDLPTMRRVRLGFRCARQDKLLSAH